MAAMLPALLLILCFDPKARWLCQSAERDAIAKTDECFNTLRCVRKHVVSRAPSARFTEHDDGGAAEAEDRFFLAAFKRCVEGMNLGDPAD